MARSRRSVTNCWKAFCRLKVLLTTTCTHALEMAAPLLDIAPGDQVILPSFTFVSTANAFVLRGAASFFRHSSRTLNMDDSRLESLITPRTKAIVPVHYAGVACDMDAICSIARQHNVPSRTMLTDCSPATRDSTPALSAVGTKSFHETKNITGARWRASGQLSGHGRALDDSSRKGHQS